jgi:hypothetical protein
MRFKYGSFLLVIIVRIVINLFYSIVFAPGSEVSYHPNGNCSNMGGSLELSVLLGCHHFFMHLVPVWVVLYMFQVRIKIKKEGGGGGSRGRELEEDARSVDS